MHIISPSAETEFTALCLSKVINNWSKWGDAHETDQFKPICNTCSEIEVGARSLIGHACTLKGGVMLVSSPEICVLRKDWNLYKEEEVTVADLVFNNRGNWIYLFSHALMCQLVSKDWYDFYRLICLTKLPKLDRNHENALWENGRQGWHCCLC